MYILSTGLKKLKRTRCKHDTRTKTIDDPLQSRNTSLEIVELKKDGLDVRLYIF